MHREIGIVGQGFVGTAVREGLRHAHTIHTFDIDPEKRTCDSVQGLVDRVDILFLCLPTPMRPDGSCDRSIVLRMVAEVDNAAKLLGKSVDLVVKSTVPPGTTDILDADCDACQVYFNPEFLTEANFLDDFKRQDRIILGGVPGPDHPVADVFATAYPDVPIYYPSRAEAELTKYVLNCFLATKVSFANEIYDVCSRLHINFMAVMALAHLDRRLGTSHWQVPGPDGQRGFSGSCFPKDLCCLSHLAEALGVAASVLKAAWETNLRVRPSRDWEQLKGRAVAA